MSRGKRFGLAPFLLLAAVVAQPVRADAATSQPAGQFKLNPTWRGQRFVELARDATGAVFSPNGRQVGYVRQTIPVAPPNVGGPWTSPATPLNIDNTVVILDLTTGKAQEAPLNKAAHKRVDLLAWSADGNILFAADNGQIWAVDVADTGLKPRVLVKAFADGEIRTLSLASDHKRLICRYSPKAPAPSSQWMASDYAVFDQDGKQFAHHFGKEGGWEFRFPAKEYFAGTGRAALPPRDGYAWGVVPLAVTSDGIALAVVREEPAKAEVLPLADGLRTDLASLTLRDVPEAYARLDQFTGKAAAGTTVEYRASAQANKVLRVRMEGYYTQWGGSRNGTYGVRGSEEKVFVSTLDVATRKFAPELELPMPPEEKSAGVNYRPACELMDFSDDGWLAAFWYYFNYRGNANDVKRSGLAVVDLAGASCRSVPLSDQMYVDRLRPPRIQPGGRLLLLNHGLDLWLCDPEAKSQ